MREPQVINIEALTAEILILKQQTAQGIIEIGKRLIQAKELLNHGEWLPWLEQKVEFSHTTAKRFMQVARELSNFHTLESLSQSKVFALLDLPSEDREEFLGQSHELPSGETKTVNQMTTRELQAAIKAQKEAEQRALNLAKQLEDTTDENQLLRDENRKLADRPPEVIIEEKIIEKIPDDYATLKKELNEREDELLALTTAQLVKKNRQMVLNTLWRLVQDLGKHYKRAEMEVKMIPYDKEVEDDILSCIGVLENTIVEMKKWTQGDVINGECTIEI